MTPSATGKLSDTPLAHALIYARNRRLSGRLELSATDARRATVVLWRGRISAVETTPLGMVSGGFFGVVAYELGFIDRPTLDTTLLEISKTKQLHGEVLLARRAITREQRDLALVEQIHRKVHHLFGLDDETTTYAFYDARMPVDPAISTDLVGPVWRGIRDYPPLRFVAETVRRIGDNQLRVIPADDKHVKPRLPPQETALVEMLRGRPMTLAEMKAASELTPAHVDLLAYLLVIAKHIESASGARTHPSTGALPATMPSGPVPMRSPGAISSTQIPAYRPPSAKAIATPSQAFSPAALAAAKTTSSLGTIRTPAELGLEGIAARAANIDKEDYFQVLGLSDGASAEAVRASYMRLAKTWHPDKLVTDFFSVRGDVAKIFSYMSQAQKTLTDPEGRRAYLASRRPKDEPRTRALIKKEIDAAFAAKGFEVVSKLCQELITMDADDSEAIALQAWSDVRAGDASEDELKMALVKMDRAVNVDRTSVPALFYRGLVQKKLNNVFAAFRDFARAVQLDPSHTDAEREVRLFAMRAKKGSGEHKLAVDVLQKIEKK
ncbi:MAG: DnaJ domain-containing protein [Labilithrix sp.]|nr:DnaJ domain-containing protein [Labilithrix sp.]MCW5812715.1 DnaJ domain-containing protein [Labilithrix sp.]